VTLHDERRPVSDHPHRAGPVVSINLVDGTVLGDTVAKFSRCGTELYVNTSCPREDRLWAIGEALDHLRGLAAPGAQAVRPLRWSRSAAILPY
jgi:hypothetical protein